MTISEIVEKISREKLIPGRFPSRLIFVRNFDDYMALVNELRTVCDDVIDIAQFAKDDMIPRCREFKKSLTNYEGQQLLLLSFGEYLRICIKREVDRQSSYFPDIWEQKQAESSITKYIIPIFGSKELYDRIMPVADERQQRYIWEINSTKRDTEYGLTIYSPEFAEAVTVDAENFQQWLENWTQHFATKERQNFTLRTSLYRYAETMYGDVNVSIIREPFSYAVSLVTDGERLEKGCARDELWKFIANSIVRGQPLEATIRHIFNVGHTFDPVAVFARYSEMSTIERDLILLWYKLYPAEDYCTFALSNISMTSEISVSLRDSIFALPNMSDDFIEQRSAVLKVFEVEYDEGYFAKLGEISSLEIRLKILTCKAPPERAYAIKTVSDLFRAGADINAVARLVRTSFPELSEYIMPSLKKDEDVGLYFDWYRKSKIINRPNTDIPCVIDFDEIDSRNKVIQQNQSDNCKLFWVDGLGVEWLPVLMYRLQFLDVDNNSVVRIAKSKLPSETIFNHEWTGEDEKWDALDKLAHKGIPDDKNYFSCMAQQFEIIGKIVRRISELLMNYDRVILTSDHGSSRLAALSFHDVMNFAIEPPKNATVRSFGRYVELKDTCFLAMTEFMELVEYGEKRYVVMKTYEHFKQSGNVAGGNTDENAVAGEVHGGMTPEEHLVPVIVIMRKKMLPKKVSLGKPKGIEMKEVGLP